MIDINKLKQNPALYKKAVSDKGVDIDIDELIKIDDERRELILKVESLRQQRNQAAQERDIEKGKQVKLDLDKLEEELKDIQFRFDHLMLYVPNIPSDDSPIGTNSDSNKEVLKWGEVPKFDFTPKDHVELGKLLNILDLEAGVKVSGFRGYYLKNQGAILHQAILRYAQDKILEAGFSPMIPPTLVHGQVLVGSGHFPFGQENIYQLLNPGKMETGEDIKNPIFITGTSEPSLLGYFIDKTLDESELPIKVTAQTHCYRSEVGDYGKDVKGLYRVHEFDKVEQVVICKDDLEESEEHFKAMQQISEGILQSLNIPYRVVQTSTGDMGAGKYKMNDIEAWMAGRGNYGETHSNSNLTDWQARRLNLKFKDKEGKTHFAYTLNNTVVASPRILIPILENFQQEDGTVIIPEALRKYTGFDKISP